MITYNDIYEAAKKERYSESLQPIQKSFIKEVAEYLRDKKEIASREENTFSDVLLKTKKQLENAITLFQELLRRRRKKILNLVLIASETGISRQDFENMLLLEKQLFEELMKCIESSDKKLNEILSSGEEKEESKNSMVVFLEDLETFNDLDGNSLGPFEKGQIANIPKDVAKILLEDSKIEIIER
jgi:DNA replication initiation complex subunit (GINS family)